MAAKRKYSPREYKLLKEWILENYKEHPRWSRVRLGPIPGTPEDRIYAGLRRWADQLILDGDEMIIVEAKMRPDPGAISQLELYKKMYPLTPEFARFKDLPVRLVFLTSREDPVVRELAEEKGIEFVIFAPEWVKEWWEEKAAMRPS